MRAVGGAAKIKCLPAPRPLGGSAMGIEDEVSSNAVKVYKAMKDLAYMTEEKMGTAERIFQASKLPKNMVLNALQELQNKGWVRRKVREKAAGYYLLK